MEGKYAGEGKYTEEEDTLCKGFKDVTVVENENRRSKSISHYPKEVQQVCKGKRRTSLIESLPGPEALKALLLQVDPAGEEEDLFVWFYEYKLLSAERIQDIGVLDSCQLVPFAENIDGDFLATGEHDHKGGVYSVSNEGEVEGEEEARSFAEYLEAYRNALLSNKLEYIEECGMVEKTPVSPTNKK